MHVAVSEFARHVCGLDGANSTEMDPETPFPVIDLLPEQKEIEDLGGTMRLGAQAVELAEGPRARETYGEPVDPRAAPASLRGQQRATASSSSTPGSSSRGRSRRAGSSRSSSFPIIRGSSRASSIPEFKSRPTRPAPLFRGFVGAALERARERVDAGATAVVGTLAACR